MKLLSGNVALILTFYFIQILCVSVVFSKAQEKTCVTRNGTEGICTKLSDCTDILTGFEKYGLAPIFKSLCSIGFYGVSVCCPGHRAKLKPESDRTREIGNYYEKQLYPPHCGLSKIVRNRIVGGDEATLGSWPWMVAVGIRFEQNNRNLKFTCGGTLVSSRHVVTAAHCMILVDTLYVVRLGEHDLTTNDDGAHPIDVRVQKFTVHPDYNDTTYENDIAVLKLEREITFTDQIRPICLPLNDNIRNRDFNNSNLFVTGWGVTSYDGPSSSVLLEVSVPVIDTSLCKDLYTKKAVVNDRMLCAGDSNGGKDTCQGDSGGPLMFPENSIFYLIGVVSSGFKCALAGYPGIYTRVTHFINFILSNLT